MATTSSAKLTKEEYRRQKDLEAARKAGTAPAEIDEETGRDINPHIPQYMSTVPWYLDSGKRTLAHQRITKVEEKTKDWYKRGAKKGKAATKYRKGACENCGAMTHTAKDCVERPRKKGAKFTGKDIMPDEVIEDLDLSYDGKRDQWNGYDPNEYIKVVKEWELIDQERQKKKEKEMEEKMKNEIKNGITEPDNDSDDDDEDKYAEASDMPGQKVDTKTRTTVRNLRIREDTAKYLRNLDPNSAFYDPKTRSMRDNPNKDKNPEELSFAGDNFLRYSGDSKKMAQLQLFAWDASEKGSDVHLLANPTQGELLYKEVSDKKVKLKDDIQKSILEKYGGAKHLNIPSKDLLYAQTENYVEYSRTGKIIKGQEKAKVKSKYEEEVYINNHTTVWGSYWENGKWGYKCCHSLIKNSYCTGSAGIEANKNSVITSSTPQNTKSLLEEHLLNQKSEKSKKRKLEKAN